MYRCVIAAVMSAGALAPSWAQQLPRPFPPTALRGTIVFGDFPQITLNGNATKLSPGAQVRNRDNLIVMAGSLAGSSALVNYTPDLGGTQVRDVWILRPDEAAITPWPTTLYEARTWSYDPLAKKWIKP